MKKANPDIFGYYKVGDRKTYSKVEAIELQQLTGIHPYWYFNDAEFTSYNWTVEPSESLAELYARRAWQLRNDYDYLVLWYSGGADSGNILQTFIDNNIPLDEVLTINYHSLDPREDCYFHAEQVKVSYPKLDELRKQGHKFRHRAVDLTEIVYNILIGTEYLSKLNYYHNSRFGLTHISASYVRETEPDYLKLQEKGKRIGFIYGVDKPRLYQDGGRFCLRFSDMVDACISVRTQMLGRDYEYDELFYWSPDAKDLLCKQAHTVMRFMKQNQQLSALAKEGFDWRGHSGDYMLEDLDRQYGPGTAQKLSFNEIINWLIYPKHNPFTFTSGKHKTAVYSLRDEYWQKDRVYNRAIEMGVQHLRNLPTYWWANPNDITEGLKGMLSPRYWLE